MKTVLLKTQIPQSQLNKAVVRYRLYAIYKNHLEHLCSEENLPKINQELIRLDFPPVVLELNQLEENEQKLVINTLKKNKELSAGEKIRFYKYQKRKPQPLKVP